MQLKILPFMMLASLAYGCTETTDSGNITNRGLYAEIDVEEIGSGYARVVAELNVGGHTGTNVSLSSGEQLNVTANGTVTLLQKDFDLLDVDYEASVAVSPEPTLFTIDFYRVSSNDILGSTVILPASFSITNPTTSDLLSTEGMSRIEWTPRSVSQSIQLSITATCRRFDGSQATRSAVFDTIDDGFFDVNLGSQVIGQMGQLNREHLCSVDIEGVRESRGNLSLGYGEGGSINSRRVRSVRNVRLVIN